MLIIVGIDPGFKGGLAIKRESGMYAYPMPIIKATTKKEKDCLDLVTLTEVLKVLGPNVHVIIEKVGAMPKQGVTSMFRFGEQFGALKGICVALGYTYELVTPQAWKKKVLVDYEWKGDKKMSIQYATDKYPDTNLFATKRSRVKSDGMADAICLADYGNLTVH